MMKIINKINKTFSRKKLGGILFLSCFSLISFAQKYQTKVFVPDVITLQVYLQGDELQDPVIRMGTEDHIQISFDQMSHILQFYSYSLELCNADWTPSSLLPIEYLEGFNDNRIEESNISFNTTFDYTHYSFELPNENIKPLLSGNYVVKIYETDFPDKILMTACFSIDENLLGITGRVTGSTVQGVNTKYQLLNFEIDCSEHPITDPNQDLKILVQQNGRIDNQVFGIKPTYILPTRLVFEENRNLIFEGGNEFCQIDFSHIRNFSGWIERISFHRPYYHVETMPSNRSEFSDYQFSQDVNGRFKIHGQNIWSPAEIDYSVVHFVYPREEPWLDGAVYVAGYFNYNLLDGRNKMKYNFESKQYELDVVLKNGGYNYQYLFLPAGQPQASSIRVSSSHWQTENDYKIYVYYRPYAGRHDRLVGVRTINSIHR
jgi:hypothetical protein